MRKSKPRTHFYNPTIRHRNQKPQLCFVGNLAMIANRHGIEDTMGFGLDDLAYRFGLYIDGRDAHMFGGNLRKRGLDGDDPRIGFQLKNLEEELVRNSLQGMMGGMKIGLCRPSDIGRKNMKEYLIERIRKRDSIMMNVYLERFDGRKTGHYVTLVGLTENRGTDIYVADPSPFTPDFWKEKLNIFLDSMSPEWDGQERGIITFSGPIYREEDDPKTILKHLKKIQRYKPSITQISRREAKPKEFPLKPRKECRS